MHVISRDEAEPLLDWVELSEELRAGHEMPQARIDDMLLTIGSDTIHSRMAIIDGIGIASKTATIFPGNAEAGLPTINGAMVLYSGETGIPEALLDFRLVTKWKTAADSLLGARLLARPESRRILIVGAGTVARSLVEAYSSVFKHARFRIWNRTPANAEKLVAEMSAEYRLETAADLAEAAGRADVIACATMSPDPVIKGEWLVPGTHVDLVGAYRPDMREVDDTALLRSRIFVDSRETAVEDIGELAQPIESGVLDRSSVIADYYDIASGSFSRQADDEITLFKNGGGAHLDLMTARYIFRCWQQR